MAQTYSSLWLSGLTPEQKAKTCGYWYTISERAMAHTAFRTKEALVQFLDLVGIPLPLELPETGEHFSARLVGSYRTAMHWDQAELDALDGYRTRALSNGQWTQAVITTDPDGLRTIHTVNVNVDRINYDWSESQSLQDAGKL